MDQLFGVLLSYLLLYKFYALFFFIFTSAIIVPWPENTLLLATGAFAGQGYFSLTLCFIVAIVANVLGDLVGYSLTYFWGYKVIKEHHIKKYKSLDKLDRYIRQHAVVTVVLTRFTGTIGPLVNFLCGLADVPMRRFLPADILGNALDIGIFLGAGYLLGQLWTNFSDISDLIGWIFLVSVLIFFTVRIFWKK